MFSYSVKKKFKSDYNFLLLPPLCPPLTLFLLAGKRVQSVEKKPKTMKEEERDENLPASLYSCLNNGKGLIFTVVFFFF